MTKYEKPAMCAFMALVVGDWIVRLLSLDSSGLGDGALLWVRLLFIAFLLFWASFLLWTVVALASAGLAWLLLAGIWRIVGSTCGPPYHYRPGLHFGVGSCLFLLLCVWYYTQPGPFLVALAVLLGAFDLVLGAPR